MSTRCNIYVKIKDEDRNRSIVFTPDLPNQDKETIENINKWVKENPVSLSGKYLKAYCHYDGYPDGVGKALLQNFNTYQKAINLAMLGDMATVNPTKPFFDNPAQTPNEIKVNNDIEYIYLFKDNIWHVMRPSWSYIPQIIKEEDFTPLAAFLSQKEKQKMTQDVNPTNKNIANQFTISLPEPILKHSIGVAKFMAWYAQTHPKLQADPYQYYVIGLLHDIGKLYPGDPDATGKNKYKNHAQKGGLLLKEMGFSRYKEVMHHGHPEDGYFSVLWLILNLADLSINKDGNIIPIKQRVNNIATRYGNGSVEYQNALTLMETLITHKIISPEGEIL